jgi:hypothetical protein
MASAYTNPADEKDPYKLPDLSLEERDGKDSPEVCYLDLRQRAYKDRLAGDIAAALHTEGRAKRMLNDCANPEEVQDAADDLVAVSADEASWAVERQRWIDQVKGWYFAICRPGCLPDSDWFGPYPSDEAALEEARDMFADDSE